MSKSMSSITAIWMPLVFACAVGCRKPEPVVPPVPPPPVPVAQPEPPPPEPPPPKCESLDENCTAAADTELELEDASVRFAPPEEWLYAREPGLCVAVAPSGDALMALTAAPNGAREAVLDAIQKLLDRLQIEDVRVQMIGKRLGKADAKLEAGQIAVQLWEIDKRRQRGRPPKLKDRGTGTLLIFVAPASEEQVVVGAGFVVTPDAQSLAGMVMKAVQSLRGPDSD